MIKIPEYRADHARHRRNCLQDNCTMAVSLIEEKICWDAQRLWNVQRVNWCDNWGCNFAKYLHNQASGPVKKSRLVAMKHEWVSLSFEAFVRDNLIFLRKTVRLWKGHVLHLLRSDLVSIAFGGSCKPAAANTLRKRCAHLLQWELKNHESIHAYFN